VTGDVLGMPTEPLESAGAGKRGQKEKRRKKSKKRGAQILGQ
jgi:hypothetical protein